MTTTETISSRYIPANSTAITHELGIAYAYEAREAFHAIAYRGKAGKSSWSYRFKTAEQRDKEIADWFKSLEASARFKAERRAERSKPHEIPVGAVVVNSWGYDQTNIDFYQVVKASANYVWLRPIGYSDHTETGFMSGRCTPAIDKFMGDEVTQHRAEGKNVNFRHGGGSIWNGQPEHWTAYA